MGRVRNQAESTLDLSSIGAAGTCEHGASRMTLEQRHAKEVFELLNVVADGGRSDTQLFGPPREASVTRGRFKREKSLEGR